MLIRAGEYGFRSPPPQSPQIIKKLLFISIVHFIRVVVHIVIGRDGSDLEPQLIRLPRAGE